MNRIDSKEKLPQRWPGLAIVIAGLLPWLISPSDVLQATPTFQDDLLAQEFPLVRVVILLFLIVPVLHVVTGVSVFFGWHWGKRFVALLAAIHGVAIIRLAWYMSIGGGIGVWPEVLLKAIALGVCLATIRLISRGSSATADGVTA